MISTSARRQTCRVVLVGMEGGWRIGCTGQRQPRRRRRRRCVPRRRRRSVGTNRRRGGGGGCWACWACWAGWGRRRRAWRGGPSDARRHRAKTGARPQGALQHNKSLPRARRYTRTTDRLVGWWWGGERRRRSRTSHGANQPLKNCRPSWPQVGRGAGAHGASLARPPLASCGDQASGRQAGSAGQGFAPETCPCYPCAVPCVGSATAEPRQSPATASNSGSCRRGLRSGSCTAQSHTHRTTLHGCRAWLRQPPGSPVPFCGDLRQAPNASAGFDCCRMQC